MLLTAMVVLWAVRLPGSYGSDALILALNFVFSTMVSLLVVYLVSRSFLIRGTPGLLTLGCGVLTWSAAGIVAKTLNQHDANLDVTIHNTCVCISALFNVASAVLLLRARRPLRARGLWLGAAYVGTLGLLGLVALAALHGYTPTFFVQDAGGTPVRQLVLGSAIVMFLVTAGLLKGASRKPLPAFLHWYILAMGLIALGLFGILIESVYASLLSWMGLAAQWLGGVYMLIAAIASVRESGDWHISLEAALRATEEQFRLLVNGVKDYAIFMLDPEGRVLSWNDGAQRVKGWTAQEIIGQSFSRFYTPEAVASGHPQAELERAAAQGSCDDEGWRIRKDGSRFWASVTITALRDDQGLLRGFSKITRDITDRKAAEEAMREARDRAAWLARFPEENRAPVMRATADGTVLYRNPAVGKSPGWACEVGQSLPPALLPLLRQAMGQGRPLESEAELGGRSYSVSITPFVQESYVNIYGQDITERKRADEALRQSEAELSFGLELNDALRQLDDPIQVQATAARLLGERLQADRVFFSEIVVEDGIEITVIQRDYHRPGVSPVTGRFPFREFSNHDYEDYRAGRTVWSPNVFTDGREPSQSEAYRAAGVAAYLGVPLVKQGKLLSVLGVAQAQPRNWTPEEIRLTEQAADRTWHAVQRARAETRLTTDLAALTRMHDLSGRLVEAAGMQTILQDVMDAAVAIVGAQHGTFQLLEGDSLRIVAHHGHQQPFLDFFAAAENRASVCGEATRRGERVVVEDVESSPLFAGTPSLEVLRQAGVRAVQSTPLITRGGKLLGILTTQWDKPYRPDDHDLWRIDLLARQASDLVETAHSEAALRQSEADLRQAQRVASIGSWTWDIRTNKGTASEELLRIFGFDPATQTMPSFADQRGLWYPPEEWERLNAAVQESARTGVGYELELQALRNGRRIWVQTRSEAIRDSEGRIVGLRGSLQDITERRKSEQALREHESQLKVAEATRIERQRLYDVLGTLPVYVVLLDEDYRVPFANRFFEERFGKSQGRRCYEYLFGRGEPCENCETYKVMKTGQPHHWYWTGPDKRDYDIYDFPFTDTDGSRMILEMGIDITERKKAEAQVKVERQRLFDVLETLPAMICLLTSDHRITFSNRSFRERFGESDWRRCYQQCFGQDKPCDFCESFVPLKTGKPHHWEVKGPDGSVIEAHDYPFTDSDGTPVVLEMDLDITDRRRAEAELQRHRLHLEELVQERTTALEGANVELRRSNKELEQFAYVSAHDLQEPLRQVRSFIGMLKDRHADKFEGKAAEYFGYVYDGAARMSELVRGLLEYSRVGSREARHEPIAAQAALDAALGNVQASIEESHASVTHDELPSVVAEPTQLAQLFQNLIGNALKFRRAGIDPRVHIGCRRDGDQWLFSIADNGIGIAPEYHEQVFTIFQRLHTREKYSGTGIGLAICKKIVERHGGRIWIESKVGEGATFLFTLPDGGAR